MSKVKFGTFLTELVKRSGAQVDDKQQEYIDLLAANLELPAPLVNQLYSGLLNVDSAIENSDVRNRILAAGMGGIDKDIIDTLEANGLNTQIDAFKGEKNTRKKVAMLIEQIQEAERKKANGKVDPTKSEQEIANLNAQLKKLREDNDTGVNTLKSQHDNELKDLLLENILGGYNYEEGQFGREFVIKYAKDLVAKALDNHTAEFVLDNKNLKLVKKDTKGEVFDTQNNKLDLKGLLDKTVEPLIKKSDPNATTKSIITGGDGNEKKGDLQTATQLNELANTLMSQG
jgi:hypothetical protein